MELQQLGCAVWVNYGRSVEADVVRILATGANGIISDDAAMVNYYINKHFPKNSFTRTPTVVGHRGYANGGAIENTLESFKLAYEYGADIFELDVYSTSDNALVLYHDNKFANGTTHNYNTNYTGSKYIEQMTLAEVQQVKYTKDNSAITLFPEVLEYFKDKDIRIFVEFKGGQTDRTVKYTAEAVKKYGMEDRIVIICSATGFLENAIKYFDGAITNSFVYANNSITGYAPQDTPEWSYADTRAENLSILAFTLNRIGHTNSNLGPALGAVSKGFNVDNFLGEAATNRGLQVNPWTYGSANNNNIGFFSDVDSITTDVTDWFKDMAKYVSFSGDISLTEGDTYDGSNLQYTTYGRKTLDVPFSDIICSVVEGDAVEVVDGKLVAVKEGYADVLFGYKTKTASGTEYIIYADVTRVAVEGNGGEDVSDPSSEDPSDPSSSEDPSESSDPSSSEDPSDPDPDDSSDPVDPDPDPDDKDPVEPDLMKGDVNENGEIDSMDYVLLKRAYFGTYKLKDIAIGDINDNKEIDSMDYVYLRRAYFGTYKIK
jgi:glycerophosphoryl diester phosphodiesterase